MSYFTALSLVQFSTQTARIPRIRSTHLILHTLLCPPINNVGLSIQHHLALRSHEIVTHVHRCHVDHVTLIQSIPCGIHPPTRFFRSVNPGFFARMAQSPHAAVWHIGSLELRTLVSESRCKTASASRFTPCTDACVAWPSTCISPGPG